jgi:flagellar transcriptional activator FlhD
MGDEQTQGMIREMNLAYLILAQRLLREDRLTGMFRLGLSARSADLLAGFTLAQTVRLAASDQLLCDSRIGDHAIFAALVQTDTHIDVSPARTAIALASQCALEPA